MSDFRYAPIYGRNPWLMVEDADEVADFFRNSGTPFVSHRRDIVHFGSQPHVYWIESGLVASSATTGTSTRSDGSASSLAGRCSAACVPSVTARLP